MENRPTTIISHIHNPNHPFNVFYTSNPYTCDGCITPGGGLLYRCATCPNLNLHCLCAWCPATFTKFFTTHSMTWTLSHAPAHLGWPIPCNICRNPIYGMFYHCGSYVAHPLCAYYPPTVNRNPAHPCHTLRAVVDANLTRCRACRMDCAGLRYRCNNNGCDVDFHVECALEGRGGGGGGHGGVGGGPRRGWRDVLRGIQLGDLAMNLVDALSWPFFL